MEAVDVHIDRCEQKPRGSSDPEPSKRASPVIAGGVLLSHQACIVNGTETCVFVLPVMFRLINFARLFFSRNRRLSRVNTSSTRCEPGETVCKSVLMASQGNLPQFP